MSNICDPLRISELYVPGIETPQEVFFSVGGLWVLLASFHTQLEITFVTPD